MKYQMVCPICTTLCNDSHEDKCSGCGSTRDPIYVCWQLVKTVTLLIKLGLDVADTDMRLCTSHKMKITIRLTGAVPIAVFDGLPDGWQYISNSHKLFSSAIESDVMINNLEQYLENKDADGFKSVLKLAGYEIGQ